MLSLPKASVFPDTATVNNLDHLSIGGCDAVDLVKQHGSPLYVFDETTLRARCQSFRKEFGKRHQETQIAYASKAFINQGLAKLLAEEGLGFDVVSGGELAVVCAAGVAPHSIYFHGNNKSSAELSEAISHGIGYVVVDNFHELSLLNNLAHKAGHKQNVLLRVSPDVDPHTHAYTTTGILDSKFGFPISTGQAKEAIRRAQAAPYISVHGLHFHLGSPIASVAPFITAIRLVMDFASQMRTEGLNVRELSPGGGFAISYLETDSQPSVSEYADAIVSSLHSACAELNMPIPRMTIEPGRAIVGPAGVALYTVGSTKTIPGVRTYVAVDGGMGDNIRPALYGAAYEAVAANKMCQPASNVVSIGGKFCESGDILIRDVPLPSLEPGDIVAIPASGAYNISMSSNYNHNPRPAIVLVHNGQSTVLRRRETYADLMRQDTS